MAASLRQDLGTTDALSGPLRSIFSSVDALGRLWAAWARAPAAWTTTTLRL
jgi:hypothetical protein